MDISTKLKMLMVKKGMKQLDVGKEFGMAKNTFNNLLQRNNFKLNDIEKIADILNCDLKVVFVDRETKEEM